jgi:hypothetical protein
MPRGIPNSENAECCLLLPFEPGCWTGSLAIFVLILAINGIV